MKFLPLVMLLGCSFAQAAATSYIGLELPAEGPRVPIASLTKMMTAIVASRQDLSEAVEVTKADFDTIKGTRSKLMPGLVVSKNKLLELALVGSDNRAAFALARSWPGGREKFIEAMNEEADRLGANARFTDSAGLGATNEASSRAVAVIGRELASNKKLAAFSVEQRANVGRALWNNTNMYVRTNTLSLEAQKTGFTNEAGSCLYMLLKDGKQLIILGAKNKYAEAKRLLKL